MKLDISSSGSQLLISSRDRDKPITVLGAERSHHSHQALAQLPAHSHQLQIPADTNLTSGKGQQLYTSWA